MCNCAYYWVPFPVLGHKMCILLSSISGFGAQHVHITEFHFRFWGITCAYYLVPFPVFGHNMCILLSSNSGFGAQHMHITEFHFRFLDTICAYITEFHFHGVSQDIWSKCYAVGKGAVQWAGGPQGGHGGCQRWEWGLCWPLYATRGHSSRTQVTIGLT